MSEFYGQGSSDFARKIYLEQETTNEEVGRGFQLGTYNSRGLIEDPKRFAFLLSRHKFVAKMLDGYGRVLEVGCQEGMGSVVVAKAVRELVSVDFFRSHIEEAQVLVAPHVPNVTFRGFDMLDGPVEPRAFDGAFSMDVLEHIDPAQEGVFLRNVADSLVEDGVFICGMPSLESQQYASPQSRAGHINCKKGADFRTLMEMHFRRVFMFGMNDEVVHTGYFGMCHYLIALCVSPRR